jgi:tyrosine-protein phosphatase YwqE
MTAGFIDLHNHLGVGIDDGAKSPGDALEMARALNRAGFVEAVVTSHIKQGYWENTRETITRAVDALRPQSPIPLHVGAEHTFDDLYVAALEAKALVTLGEKTRVHLLEFQPTNLPRDLDAVLFRVRLAGYRPLFAHPERYADFARDIKAIERLVMNGALLQLDIASLAGGYGGAQEGRAWKLLDRGLYHVAASDLHKAEGIDAVIAGMKRLRKSVGEKAAEALLAVNPRRIVAGEEIA